MFDDLFDYDKPKNNKKDQPNEMTTQAITKDKADGGGESPNVFVQAGKGITSLISNFSKFMEFLSSTSSLK